MKFKETNGIMVFLIIQQQSETAKSFLRPEGR